MMIKNFLCFFFLGFSLLNSATFCENEDKNEAKESKKVIKDQKEVKKKVTSTKKMILYISSVPICIVVSFLSYLLYIKIRLEKLQRKIQGINEPFKKEVKNAKNQINNLIESYEGNYEDPNYLDGVVWSYNPISKAKDESKKCVDEAINRHKNIFKLLPEKLFKFFFFFGLKKLQKNLNSIDQNMNDFQKCYDEARGKKW